MTVGIITFILATVGGRIASGKTSGIVVASSDMTAGRVLHDNNLNIVGKIKGNLPAGFLTSKSQADGLSLAYPVKAGEPIVQGLVSKTPQRDGLYPGEVGVWVGVTLTTSGMAKPGDLVDVYLSTASNQYGKENPPQIVSSLQGVRVVAVVNSSGQPVKADTSDPNGNVPAAVELAIPKTEAGEFSSIASGKVSLMLDPFATPQTTYNSSNNININETTIPQPQISQPQSSNNITPGVPSNPKPVTTQPTTVTPTTQATPTAPTVPAPNTANSPVQSQNSSTQQTQIYNPSNSQNSASQSYTPPVFNPTTDNSQNK
jgi:pilus assembly protein CpaB